MLTEELRQRLVAMGEIHVHERRYSGRIRQLDLIIDGAQHVGPYHPPYERPGRNTGRPGGARRKLCGTDACHRIDSATLQAHPPPL